MGVSYSFTYTASGNPAPAFSVTSGSLPPGLSLSTGGALSGTPTTAGAYQFTVSADTGVGAPAEAAATIEVLAPQAPQITSGAPPSPIYVGDAYSFTFTASGDPAPTFSITSGSLPPGLSLNPDGTLSGAPTAPGSYTFTVTAENGAGQDSLEATIIVLEESLIYLPLIQK